MSDVALQLTPRKIESIKKKLKNVQKDGHFISVNLLVLKQNFVETDKSLVTAFTKKDHIA